MAPPLPITFGAASARGFGLFSAPAAVLGDEYFEYVTLLLPGNGTNGAQNNTFLDSSTNNFTITRNGNTTQGTFSPYGDNWSNYFDGNGDYLTSPQSTSLDLSGDFTVELWAYFNSVSGTTSLVGKWGGSGAYAWIFQYVSGTGLRFFTGSSGALGTSIDGAFTAVANTWYHLAVTRSSNSVRLFVNGTQVGSTTTNTNNLTASNQALNIGRNADTNIQYLTGYISNLRIVKGTAVYTAAFTPPTAPLTAITNTSLLTCQSNRFIDNSTNAFTITVNGDVSVQRFSPFSPTASYSTSVIGGSGYFDGSGDYLTAAGTYTLSGNFTIEGWMYHTAISGTGYNTIFYAAYSTSLAMSISSTNALQCYVGSASGSGALGGTTSIPLVGQWVHFALVRSGTDASLFLNGTRFSTAAGITGSWPLTNNLLIGRDASVLVYPMLGYLADFQVTNGTAKYSPSSTTISVPTAPMSVSGKTLALQFTNAGIIDNAMMNDLETVGNAQISTAQSKFGGASILLNGTTDYLTAPSNAGFSPGTGDFTIECWAYITGTTGEGTLFYVNVSSGINLFLSIGGQWGIARSGVAVDNNFGSTPTFNTWNHLAVARSGSTIRAFVNGTQVFSGANSSNYAQGPAVIGSSLGFGIIAGYIDDLRITKGYARYTANFTAPTAPFPTR